MEKLTSFTGATLNNTGCCEPPDTEVAVSPNRVFEAVNLTGFGFDHGGNALGSFDLTSFMSFGVANNFGSDPKVVYDAGSDRWFMTLMVCQNAGCGGNWSTMGVDLAVSQTNDPFGSWLIYQNIYSGTPFNDQGNLQDQPKLGFSDDKVTITDNVYSGHCGAGSCFAHEDVITWNKAELFTGSAHYVGFTSGYAFDSIPAIETSATAGGDPTQYIVWQGFGSLGVNQITGVPGVSAVSNSNTQSPGIGNMTPTVDAAGIPSGAASSNFLETATISSTHLWTASTDGCTPGGDSTRRDCTRVDEVDVSNANALTVALDQNIGDVGAYETYPSITQDCTGDLIFGITYSNVNGTLPTATAIGTTTPGSGYTRYEYLFGDTTYSGGRWGDYSATVEDPSDCGNVWTAQEFGGQGSAGNWATGIGQFSFDSPFADSFSPHTGPATGGTVVDILGFDFVNNGTSVSFGSTPAAGVTFIDAHHIQAVSPPGSGGPVDITVTTSNGTTSTSSRDQFSWTPVVTKAKPRGGPTGGGTQVDITGAGFTGATAVHFGSAAAAMLINSDTDITAFAPAHSAGTVHITVTGPTGTSALHSADLYAYGPPIVSSISPHAGPTAGGNTVSVNGSGFVPGAKVSFGALLSPSVTFVSGTHLTAKVPAHSAGTVDLRVSTPAGTSAVSSADHYSFDPPPSLTSLVPNAGSTAGGNQVVINGTNFVSGAVVHFGGLTSGTVTFVSATQVKATAPAHSAGVVAVKVTTPGGTTASTNQDLYAYGPPTVSSFSPTSGITASLVTINGTNYVPGASVKFGTRASPSVAFVSSTQLKARVPNGAVPGKIAVTTPGGTGTSATNFTPTLSITSFSPASGPAGTVVTIHGVGFNSGSKVKFHGTAASSVTFVSSTALKARVPAAATTGLITVTNTTGVVGTVGSATNFTKT